MIYCEFNKLFFKKITIYYHSEYYATETVIKHYQSKVDRLQH